MFESLPPVPPDPIFSLVEQFNSDPDADKINLTVGAWQNDEGVTPVMECVKLAEQRMLAAEQTKNYLGIGGMADYTNAIARLMLGEDSPTVADGRFTCIQTPGGTGALRIAAEYLDKLRPQSRLWMGLPTWANHKNIFSQAEVEVRNYDYLDSSGTALDFESVVNALNDATEGDVFLFHTCCHNPSGFDLAVDQWEIVFGFLRERKLLPIFDFAYQGFRDSLDEDAWPLRRLAELDTEFLICSSNSKNFGLYGERVGALTGVCRSDTDANMLGAYLKSLIRAVYSNPPKHGAYIVATILGDPELRAAWIAELAGMRGRIGDMRELLIRKLTETCGPGQFDFMRNQSGMFSFSGLTAEQVDRLRDEFSIYMLRSGRINVSGVSAENVDRICESIAVVTGHAVGDRV